MASATEAPPETKNLVGKVNDAIKDGKLDKSHARHYRRIAKALDEYEDNVDKYTEELVEKVGASHKVHKRPDELYLALMKQIARMEKIKDVDKVETIEDFEDDDLDKIRNHLNINYGVQDETELHKLLDTVAGGKYKSSDEVRTALRELANRKGQHYLSKHASAWANEKEWAAHAGKGGTNHKFMQIVEDHNRPEGARREVDTYKKSEEAIRHIVGSAQELYQEKKAARRKS